MKTEQIVASEQKKVEAIEALMDNRYNWTEFMNALQDAKPIDVWITSIKPMDKTPKTAAPKKSTPFGPAINLHSHCESRCLPTDERVGQSKQVLR